MVKPLLEVCRVDPGDVFTYLSWSHIMSRSNFRIREKKFSNFIFYAYFIKGNFKAPVEKLFSAHLTKFFHRILKIFLISKTISTWVLEVFLDVSEQVFILVYDVWMRFRENRQKIQSVAILVRAFLYEFVTDFQEAEWKTSFWANFLSFYANLAQK